MRLEFGRDMPGFSQIRLQNVGQRAPDALRPASAKSHTEDLLSCLCLPASAVFTRQWTKSILCPRGVFSQTFPSRSFLLATGTHQIQSGPKKSGDVITGWQTDGADPVAVVVTREHLHERADGYRSSRAPANSQTTRAWTYFN